MQVVSEYRKKIAIGAILAVIIVSALAASAILISPKSAVESKSPGGPPSQLLLQLTDPPIVPVGTTSLNLTFSEIDLTIASSVSPNQTIAVIPTSGSATLNLLRLQNISQTLASASIPSGAQIESATFVVSSIEIEVNGTRSAVTLATGADVLSVPLTVPTSIQNTNALLLDLNPIVMSTSSGYQMIPSSVAVLKPQSEVTAISATPGNIQNLSIQDQSALHRAKGSISANLLSISVSNLVTTITVQVTNNGTVPARLVVFGFHGDFQWVCPTESDKPYCRGEVREVFLLPGEPQNTTVTTTTTVTGCAPRHMSLVNPPDLRNDVVNPIIMNPGQCLTFTFSSPITLKGFGNHVLVPSTEPGQQYVVRVVGTNGAQTKIECTLQRNSPPVCVADPDNDAEN